MVTIVGCKQQGPPLGSSAAKSARATAVTPPSASPVASLPAATTKPAAASSHPKPGRSTSKAVAPRTHRTTSGALAVRNLDSSVAALLKAGAATTKGQALLPKLISTRLLRAQFIGTAGDLLAADKETAAAVTARPQAPAMWLLRAKVQSALHRWKAALTSVEKARTLGADDQAIQAQRTSYRAAMGDSAALSEQLVAAEAAVAKRESYANLAALGTALAQLGKFDAADAAYVSAQDAYRDISPFPRAWIDFQRGVMWAERAGQSDRALALYEAAVTRLPQYHTAVIHLSELLVESKQAKRAIALLKPIVARAEASKFAADPEATGTLGELLAMTPASRAEGERLLKSATAMYEGLLTSLPEAFSDHGAEFFMANGDLKRATALADANLKVRTTARAYDLAIRVHLAAKDSKTACGLAQRAQSWSSTHPVLGETLADTHKAGCRIVSAVPPPTSGG